ncbi:P22 tail accessory factor [Caballeronia turbans]|nr:P22 tail accessory factor [Caballeronia turbans]
MKAPKSFFVENGLAELGLSGAVFDFPPEEMERICNRLDANLAELETKGARISGWTFADSPDVANAATIVNVPMGLVNLIILSAAIVAAPSIGKNLSSVTVAQLKLARDNLLFFNKKIPQYQRNTNMPVGSGNQVWADGVQFYTNRPPRLDAGPDSHVDPDMDLWSGDNNIQGF